MLRCHDTATVPPVSPVFRLGWHAIERRSTLVTGRSKASCNHLLQTCAAEPGIETERADAAEWSHALRTSLACHNLTCLCMDCRLCQVSLGRGRQVWCRWQCACRTAAASLEGQSVFALSHSLWMVTTFSSISPMLLLASKKNQNSLSRM